MKRVLCFSGMLFLFFVSSLFAKNDEFWGYHLILDCKSCEMQAITSKESLENFVRILVKKIDMKAYGKPIIEHFATHNPKVGGYSLLQLIETSAITGHFVDENGDAYIDIFSCKKFDVDVAIKITKKFLRPKKVKITYLTRQA